VTLAVIVLAGWGVAARNAPPSHEVAAGHLRSASDPCGTHPWCSTSLPASQRAGLLLDAMTLEEKVDLAADGSAGDARLGIPPLGWTDGPNGIAEGATHVTAFPAAETIAASWSTSVASAYGSALGAEAAGKGDTLLFAPTVNIVRTPKWGREAETLGEDPFLAGALAAPEIRGIQSKHVIAEVKHFAANNQEVDRVGDPLLQAPAVNVVVSQRALEEIYFSAFRAAVAQGHVASALCSYNRINGLYSCQDPATLAVLRGFGLSGFVEPDETLAVRDVAAAANAGVDNFVLGGLAGPGSAEVPVLRSDVADGQISLARLNAMTRAVLTAMFSVGLFDHPRTGSPRAVASTTAHLALAEHVAEQATVLLKNESAVLPISRGTTSLAVIGADAGAATQIEENGSSAVLHGPVISPLSAIRRRAGGAVRVSYTPGTLGVVALPSIPSRVLRPVSGTGHGLSASFYTSTRIGGPTVQTRVDPTVDFQGPAVALRPIPGTTAHSGLWRGTLLAPATGVYRFSLAVAGQASLYLGHRRVVSGNSEIVTADFSPTGFHSPGGPAISFQGVARLRRGERVPIQIDYSTGSSVAGAALHVGWQPPDPQLLRRAVTAARHAQVAIVFVNDVTGEGMDRTSLALPGDQDRLIEAVAAANPRTIVVLHTAGPVLMPWLSKVAGVLEAWYPGQQSGAAIAATLFGDADPSGRLPVTFPASESQGPATKAPEYPGVDNTAHYSEGIFVGYRYYDHLGRRPMFPFGYGLSYTSFSLGQLRVRTRAADRYTVSLPVRNTGHRAGAEVVELYVGFPSQTGEPPNQLKGFAKVLLSPGETRTVTIALARSSFSTWNSRANRWTVAPGTYTIRAGTSSRDLPRSQRITLTRS
jgi:beta-glucosidase